MFVRVKKIGPYEYLYLVENVREGGRHVQRVIKALGRRDAVVNSDLLDGLIASAARHSRRSIVLSSFYRGELAELRRRSIGPDLVFGRLWVETGCRDVLRRHLADRRFGFDVERTIYLTVLHRLMISGSDRHASTWQHSVHIPGADALTLDHAYKAMAWLGEDVGDRQANQTRCRTEVIEEDKTTGGRQLRFAVRRTLGCLLRHHLAVFRRPGRRHAGPKRLFEGFPPTAASGRAGHRAG